MIRRGRIGVPPSVRGRQIRLLSTARAATDPPGGGTLGWLWQPPGHAPDRLQFGQRGGQSVGFGLARRHTRDARFG